MQPSTNFSHVLDTIKTENTHTHTHTHMMDKIKTADKASLSNTESKLTEIGLKETERNKALPAVNSVIDHSVVIF